MNFLKDYPITNKNFKLSLNYNRIQYKVIADTLFKLRPYKTFMSETLEATNYTVHCILVGEIPQSLASHCRMRCKFFKATKDQKWLTCWKLWREVKEKAKELQKVMDVRLSLK